LARGSALFAEKLREQVLASVWTKIARSEVECSVGAVQQPPVAVEIAWKHRDARLALGEIDHRSQPRCSFGSDRVLGERTPIVGVSQAGGFRVDIRHRALRHAHGRAVFVCSPADIAFDLFLGCSTFGGPLSLFPQSPAVTRRQRSLLRDPGDPLVR